MKPATKVGLVVLGYIAAFVIAFVVVWMYVAVTSGADRQTYAAMYDFGDSLFFLAAFGLAAVPATAAALFFLRARPGFWVGLAVLSIAVAFTSLLGLVVYLAPAAVASNHLLRSWSAFAALKILLAPLFAVFFLLSGVFAPNRSTRIALLAASIIEIAAFAYVALTRFRPPGP